MYQIYSHNRTFIFFRELSQRRHGTLIMVWWKTWTTFGWVGRVWVWMGSFRWLLAATLSLASPVPPSHQITSQSKENSSLNEIQNIYIYFVQVGDKFILIYRPVKSCTVFCLVSAQPKAVSRILYMYLGVLNMSVVNAGFYHLQLCGSVRVLVKLLD